MAKRKRKEASACRALMHGGPNDGARMRIALPPTPYLRLAIPHWATYKLRGLVGRDAKSGEDEYAYDYTGTEPPPKETGSLW